MKSLDEIDSSIGKVQSSVDDLETLIEATARPGTELNSQNTPGDEDSTFIIASPGYYYLGQDLAGEESKNGISISVNNVIIDLRGYRMVGTPTSLFGISGAGASTLTVFNGEVSEWPGGGINLGSRSRVENVILDSNGTISLSVGYFSYIRDCRVFGNDTSGTCIKSLGSSIIEDSMANHALFTGIRIDTHTIVRDCIIQQNGSDGIYQAAGGHTLIEGCLSRNNGGNGINLCGTAIVRDNNCTGNTDAGIQVRCGNNVVTQNLLTGNDTGIALFSNQEEQVFSNILTDNTTTNISGKTGNLVGPEQSVATATSPTANLVD